MTHDTHNHRRETKDRSAYDGVYSRHGRGRRVKRNAHHGLKTRRIRMTPTSPSLEVSPVQAFSPRGRFFTTQTFHYETLRNAGYILSQCADLGEMLETTKQITEGDVQSWYAAWAATADRVEALAARTQDPLSKGGAYMRASTYQRMGEFLLPPDDPKRPGSFDKAVRLFFQGLDAVGVRYEYLSAPYEN